MGTAWRTGGCLSLALLGCAVSCGGGAPEPQGPPEPAAVVSPAHSAGGQGTTSPEATDTSDADASVAAATTAAQPADADGPIICRLGQRNASMQGEEPRQAQECPTGTQCCYPCGIAGCDWHCASPELCASWRALP